MLTPSLKTLLEYTRRMVTCALLMLCVMPAAEAEAATQILGQEMWSNTGFCLAGSASSNANTGVEMTPDARAYKLSIELRALQEMLRTQQAPQAASSLDAPCEEVDEHLEGPALCPQPEEQEKSDSDEVISPRFVAASLIEDIVPLERPESPYSCNATSSGPDRCESYPAHPHRLHLDVTFSSAVLSRALTPAVHQDTKPRTLPLVRALPRHLLGAASGFPRDDERPPQA